MCIRDSSDTAMNKEAYKDVVFGIYTRDDTYEWKGNVAIEPDTLLATSGIDEEGHLVHTPELPVGNYYLKELQTNSAYKLDAVSYTHLYLLKFRFLKVLTQSPFVFYP